MLNHTVMKKLFTLKSVLYYCLLTVLMQTQIAQAQWSNDAHENNCVTNALQVMTDMMPLK